MMKALVWGHYSEVDGCNLVYSVTKKLAQTMLIFVTTYVV